MANDSKSLRFFDDSNNGIPSITVHSSIAVSQTTDANGEVFFTTEKQKLTVDETSAPPSAIAGVTTNFPIKSVE